MCTAGSVRARLRPARVCATARSSHVAQPQPVHSRPYYSPPHYVRPLSVCAIAHLINSPPFGPYGPPPRGDRPVALPAPRRPRAESGCQRRRGAPPPRTPVFARGTGAGIPQPAVITQSQRVSLIRTRIHGRGLRPLGPLASSRPWQPPLLRRPCIRHFLSPIFTSTLTFCLRATSDWRLDARSLIR